MPVETPPDLQRRRSKNWTVFGVLLGIVVLIYVIAIVRMSGG